MDRPENISVRHTVGRPLLITAATLGIASAFLLAFLVRGAETILGKIRYTSICTQCGVQTAADFYYFLDSEIAQAEQTLPISRKTLLPRKTSAVCSHDYVLVGKTESSVALNGAFTHQVRGQPAGDAEFAKPEIRNSFLALSQKNPSAAPAFIQALAKERYRGQGAPFLQSPAQTNMPASR